MNGLPYLCRFKNETQMYRIGLDVGSTTIKTIVLDESGRIVYSRYERHHAKIQEKLLALLSDIRTRLGDTEVTLRLTGAVGMGIAERCRLPFVQEVVAATNYIARNHREVSTLIDIGGEDAKVVFLHEGEATDLRMNGNCAGGTGAFIDQMAILLNVTPDELGTLALNATHIYPIASRCGVFSKTDIQNLIAKNACKEDIAASIFHAVAGQGIVTLAHGCDITAPLLFCGGPLTFLPALRKAFTDYLQLSPDEVVLPEDSHLIPAWGSALSEEDSQPVRLSYLSDSINRHLSVTYQPAESLEPIFSDDDDYHRWKERISQSPIREGSLRPGVEEVTLGIDSGSTTTKIVVLNRRNELLYTYYHGNDGNPLHQLLVNPFSFPIYIRGNDVIVISIVSKILLCFFWGQRIIVLLSKAFFYFYSLLFLCPQLFLISLRSFLFFLWYNFFNRFLQILSAFRTERSGTIYKFGTAVRAIFHFKSSFGHTTAFKPCPMIQRGTLSL